MTTTTMTPNFVNYDLGQLLGGEPNGLLLPGYDADTPDVPAFNTCYVWPAWGRDLFVWAAAPAEPLYITGPTGAGKTSAVKQLAALLHYPVYETTGHARLEVPDLIGHYVLAGQDTEWQDGPLTAAMRHGGLFLLNEIDLLDPSTAAGLNTILDGSALCIPETNEIVQPAPGFRFIATANTAGQGDLTGNYQGTLRMNAAFMDRFTVLEAGYLPQETETALMRAKFPELGDAVEAMVRVANMVRALYLDNAEAKEAAGVSDVTTMSNIVPISTRSLLRWAQWSVICAKMKNCPAPVEYALMRAIGFKGDAAFQVMLKELLQRVTK